MLSKILSLVRTELNHSSQFTIQYKINQFPDGQQTITITEELDSAERYEIEIQSRLNSFQDLELVICANQALREMGVSKVSLYVPYFLGARSDRKFLKGSCHYLKSVICPIINAQGFSKVTVLDPHSDVLEACLLNYRKLDNREVIRFALDNLGEIPLEEIHVVAPDTGALKKIHSVAERFKLPNFLVASKQRDPRTNRIIKTRISGVPTDPAQKVFIIVDDICDTGGTFIEVAKAIKEVRSEAAGYRDKVYLIVTHGIFSKGFNELALYLDGVFCTNSVKVLAEWNSDAVKVLPLSLKQLNVF
jgi:ribose-phosphate pyrophosphokinase